MKKYNKFYNVSLGNFLKVACCSLSIITIASCEEEPFEQESNSESELLKAGSDLKKAANALRKELGDLSCGISLENLDNIEHLNDQKAQELCESLNTIQTNESVTKEVKKLAASLLSQYRNFFSLTKEENKPTDDKHSQAEPELNKAEEWKKIENDVQNLIKKLTALGKDEHFCNPLNSILNEGKYLEKNDFNCTLEGLKFELYGDEDKKALENNPEVLGLLTKIESAVKAFFDKFDKSEPAVDSKVPNKPSGKI